MKPDDVTQEAWDAARDINLILPIGHVQAEIARAITAAVAAEREACADACAKESDDAKRNGLPHVAMGANWCKAAIRARSTP